MIGKEHQGVLVTLVDRATLETKIKVLAKRKVSSVTQACINMLANEKLQSITFDNGKEFAGHQAMTTALKTKSCFAKPCQ